MLLALLAAILPACADDPGASTPTAAARLNPTRAELAPLPTLLPSRTPIPPPEATAVVPTFTPAPTSTPIDFDQEVVYLRYEIPLLGLDRTLSGNVSSAITLEDSATGQELEKQNQPGVLLDLQSVLERLELDPLPEECQGCVRLTYRLELAGVEGSGWLQDPRLLASVENYFAANLGPHFPADTVVGLRRSASNTDAAHTVALDDAGQLWRWTAIDAEVPPPIAGGAPLLADAFAAVDVPIPGENLSLGCPGRPFETLYLNPDDVLAPQVLSLRCPEMTLPLDAVALYAALDGAVAPILSGDRLPEAVRQPLALDQVIYLGAGLDAADAAEVRVDRAGVVVAARGTVSATATLTETSVISLTRGLTETGRLLPISGEIARRVLVTDTASLDAGLLVLRTPTGVYYTSWDGAPPGDLAPLLEQLLRFVEALEAAATPTSEPAGTAVPAGTATPVPTPSPTVTPAP